MGNPLPRSSLRGCASAGPRAFVRLAASRLGVPDGLSVGARIWVGGLRAEMSDSLKVKDFGERLGPCPSKLLTDC